MGPPARATASRVARAIMSAQETVEGQAASSLVLIWSISSYPRTVWFGPAFFSDCFVLVDFGSINIDASQP